MEQNQNTSLFQLNLDAQNSYTLRSAASWAKVLGIVGLIIGILCFIGAIVFMQAVSQVSEYGGAYRYRSSGFNMSAIGNMGIAMYVIMGLIFVLSSIFALSAGNKITKGLRANDQATLNAGFAGVRNYFAIWAIILIIMLLFLLIGVAGSL